jgi:putative peptide zinc metalloprotease protein
MCQKQLKQSKTITMDNYAARLQPVELIQVEKNKFAITCNSKIYFVSALIFDLFKNLKNGYDLATTHQKIESVYNNVPDQASLSKIVEENIQRFLANKTTEQIQANNYINFQRKLFSKELLEKITSVFSILFNRYIFIVLFFTTAYASFQLLKTIIKRGALFNSNLAWHDGVGLVIMSYLFLLGLAVFHEIGHASATKKYGIKAKEVGFGFYLFFPVLYTNVSEIWLLSRYKRILVNLGGVYFQLIINGLLYVLFTLGVSSNIIFSLFVTNSILIAYSFNPFMRNDGYWIYSDLFDIPNLSAIAFDYPLRFIHFLKGKVNYFHPPQIKSIGQRIALFVYATAMYVLIGMLPMGIYELTIRNYDLLQGFMNTKSTLFGLEYYEAVFKIIKTLIFYCLVVYFGFRMLKMIMLKYKTI